jgi:GNAT superfamily N-acetyltransferase
MQPFQRRGIGQQLLNPAASDWQDRGGTAHVAMAFAEKAGAHRF